ncbi:MAG: bifunctional UDP-N-acetylglucosamine diphosphorylase/glucosamine-1-phosphate N-acetyltransferase GlmU [Candidatus Aminicenantes bacterium]|nr:MAG: bifunctional UDP-N-acetylglucosamine diphosphorylase/glucosamine-1-phosphate N-acetyltransferase GlmU [Candidatus Aminicenantes bacterium]
MKRKLLALVLAAGKGTRFKSDKIKVLHPMLGKPMIHLVVDCMHALRPETIHVVVGYQKDSVMKEEFSKPVEFIHQKKQLGTAHAVLAAKKILQSNKDKDLLVINGDLTLIRPESLRPMIRQHQREKNALTFLSAIMENPTGFGRVTYHENNVIRIFEEKDATPAQRRIKEANVGVYLFKIEDLLRALPKISNKNIKGEFYLTDIIEIMSGDKGRVGVYKAPEEQEIVGINDRYELAQAVEILRQRKIISLAESGVTIYDPSTTWIDFDVKIGRDTTLYSSVVLEGKTVIGQGCKLYPFVHIRDSRIGHEVKILTSTMIEESTIAKGAQIGPFTHLRPKSNVKAGAKVGNFVEMKSTVFGRGSKAGHLSYLGDTEVKDNVNIGAGTITCNYDGKKKHKTVIEEGAFIGSGTELVAPVKIGKDSYVGAGSTITKNVSSGALAVSRSRQVEKPRWVKKKRKK